MKKVGLSAEEILALCQTKVNDATSWNSKLSRERERVNDYYNGDYPKRMHAGSVPYVDQVVYTKVTQMRNQLVEVFSGNHHPLSFDAFNPQDAEQARVQTEYCAHVLYKQNRGRQILSDVIHDALISRIGVARVYWDKDEDEQEMEFDNVLPQELQAWMQDPSITDIEISENPDGTVAGRMIKKADNGKIVVESVNPEEFFIEPQAKYLGPEYYCGTRTVKTYEWLKKNFPGKAAKLKEYNFEDDLALSNSPEALSRFQKTDVGVRYSKDDGQPELRHVMVTELFCQLQKDGDLAPALHRVVFCGNVLLEAEPISKIPLVLYTALPVPHTVYGDSFAARVMPYQDILTSLSRQVLDHANITNNPRLLVRGGALKNPRELLENRLGGVVTVNSLDAVAPMTQAPLNPYVFNLMAGMAGKIDEVTGISALSQGLNPDAVSQQNSAGMIEKLMSASQVGQKQCARQFVDQFLIPLYDLISDLVITHESRQKIVQVAGGFLQVDPSQWVAGRSATPSAHLGFGEREAEAQKLIGFAAAVRQDPTGLGQKFMGPEGAYSMISDILTMQGKRNEVQRWFPYTPDKLPPPQPSPMEIADVQLKQAQAQSHIMQARAAMEKVQDHSGIAAAKQKLAEMQSMFDYKLKTEGEHRRNAETMNRIDISQREMHLEEQAPAENIKAIVSPNG